ncbi:MAG TPA: hypothetical protein VN549_08635 [Negativicutes bacterium]|nr:hypothetical protein [Negativicutes bacterium]
MFLFVAGLVIFAAILGFGLRGFCGSFGRIRSVDKEIARLSEKVEQGNADQKRAYAEKMYRFACLGMMILGMSGIIFMIKERG